MMRPTIFRLLRVRSERGMALIIALLAVFVLSILGTSVLFVTQTDEVVSRNYAAEVDALFAANTGLQIGIRNAMVDAMCDVKGQWSNSIIAIGCSSMVPPVPTGAHVDGTGAVTGVSGSIYYDAAEYRPTTPPCATSNGGGGCDAAAWADETLGEPYDVDGDDLSPVVDPTSAELSWTRNGPGMNVASGWLPNGSAYRLRFMGVPDGECSANVGTCEPYKTSFLRIVSTGLSGSAMEGANVDFDGSAGDTLRRSVRSVMATFKVKDIGIWSNAFFADVANAETWQGSAHVRGSIHIRNPNNVSPILTLNGNSGLVNNYSSYSNGVNGDVIPTVRSRIPIPSGDPHSLEAELRIRAGDVNGAGLGQSGSQPPYGSTPTLTPGKGPLDGIYTNGGLPANGNYADTIEEYDADGWDITTPDYNLADYWDSCSPANHFPTTNGFPGYQTYLKGIAGTNKGVHALNLSAINASLVFNGNGGGQPRTAIAAQIANIIAANDNEFPGTPRTPAGCSNGNMDYLVNGDIVGIFKHLPGTTPENNPSCKYGSSGGGHGFLWIPPNTAVTDATQCTAITDFITRNFVPYNTTLNTTDINRFLGRADAAAGSAAIAAGPYVDDDGVGVGAAATIQTNYGRLLIWGVIYIENQDVYLGATGHPGSKADILYMGQGNLAVANNTGAGVPGNNDVYLLVDHMLVSNRTFPCVDSIGVMAPRDVQVGDAGPFTADVYMGALYARRQVRMEHKPDFTGSYVAFDACAGCTTGNSAQHNQVPALLGCLPPEMIGDWSFYVTRTLSWSEH